MADRLCSMELNWIWTKFLIRNWLEICLQFNFFSFFLIKFVCIIFKDNKNLQLLDRTLQLKKYIFKTNIRDKEVELENWLRWRLTIRFTGSMTTITRRVYNLIDIAFNVYWRYVQNKNVYLAYQLLCSVKTRLWNKIM